ncbi:MAG: hypothetical protein ACI4JJ_08575 [Huintestinicola sp.]
MKMTLKIDIDEINYGELISALMPYVDLTALPLPDAVKQAAGQPYASSIINNFLKFVPKEKQDELVLKLFEKNRDNIIAAAHKLALKHDVQMEISDVSLSERPDGIVVE